MKNIIKKLLIAQVLLFGTTSLYAMHDGQSKSTHAKSFKVWDDKAKKWLTPEGFWHAYAKRSGGITWGTSTKYPTYSKVKELDTFMVKIGNKTCLLEFWHGRWRLANDVRRWNDKFNDYGACPRVFD